MTAAEPALLTIVTDELPPARVGRPYRARLQAMGGTAVGRSWSLSPSGAPPGMSLESAAGCLDWQTPLPAGELDLTLGFGRLQEVSGVAASQRNPGVLWVVDDGGRGEVHAMTTRGDYLQSVELEASFVDIEDMSLGPGPIASLDYIYLADTGDNDHDRSHVTLARFPEPALTPETAAPLAAVPDLLPLRYPTGPVDAEALVVSWETRTAYIITKESNAGRLFSVPVRVDAPWNEDEPVTLEEVPLLAPLPPFVTGVDVSRDDVRVAIRNYEQGWEYIRWPSQPFVSVFAEEPCGFTLPSNQQYESLAWSADGTALFTITEQSGMQTAPIYRVDASQRRSIATLAGVPQTAGRFPVTVEVTDTSGSRAVRTLWLEVTP